MVESRKDFERAAAIVRELRADCDKQGGASDLSKVAYQLVEECFVVYFKGGGNKLFDAERFRVACRR